MNLTEEHAFQRASTPHPKDIMKSIKLRKPRCEMRKLHKRKGTLAFYVLTKKIEWTKEKPEPATSEVRSLR